jgi:hypothetical protein
MRTFLAILLLLAFSTASSGAECDNSMTCGKWITKVTLKSGSATLHWTHVYEGLDTVYQVSYHSGKSEQRTFKVQGQPVVNPNHGLIAFPYCADDGCMRKLVILDLFKGKTASGELPVADVQFYLRAKWLGESLILTVEDFPDPDRNPRLTEYVCTVGDVLDCKRGIQPAVPADGPRPPGSGRR